MRVFLQPAQQGSQAVPTANNHHAHAFLTPAVGLDCVNQRPTGFLEGLEQRTVGAPDADDNHNQTQPTKQDKADWAVQPTQREESQNGNHGGVGGGTIVAQNQNREAEAKQHRAEDGEQNPALKARARKQPAGFVLNLFP